MFSTSAKNKKNIDIEALRAYAIAITIVAHLGVINPSWNEAISYYWLGGGVDLFLCISGFLIASSLIKENGDRIGFQQFTRSALPFWGRRIFRLWPAAIFWGTATLFVASTFRTPGAFGDWNDLLHTWTSSLFQITNLHLTACNYLELYSCSPDALWHYWSLSLEEQFYFLFPFVFFFINKRALLIISIACAAFQIFSSRPWPSFGWFFRTDSILMGISIALIWHAWQMDRFKILVFEKVLVRKITIITLATLLIVLATPRLFDWFMGCTVIVSSMLVFLASFDRGYIVRSERNRKIASYIGSRSYSIYLTHMPVFYLTSSIVGRNFHENADGLAYSAIAVVIAFSLTLSLSEFSYQFIETPLRAYGRRLFRTRSTTEMDGDCAPERALPCER
ncbi:acyltransferase family protein [Azospirillum isscasi]|uniref:Acyltransferase n=1 Tax=Azospirillum isscasi TaxID=3053926 RepID=A0ABU0WPM7_9PROT|nr:acyltransferase [Azospirillum isscasi]MDQ2104769.1 acyltransferase [Azospirillum isscasi]